MSIVPDVRVAINAPHLRIIGSKSFMNHCYMLIKYIFRKKNQINEP